MKDYFSFGSFFVVKILAGAFLLALSARWLATVEFAAFSQFGFFIALLNLFTSGGVQSGVIREAAAAGSDPYRHGGVAGGALAVGAASGGMLLIIALLAGPLISDLLVGHRNAAGLVALCAAAALVAGIGQIGCAYLTGIGQLRRSMTAQAIATVVGTAATVVALSSGAYEMAVVTLCFGLALILPAMLLLTPRRDLLRVWHHLHFDKREAGQLARFAAIFLTTAVLMPTALFVLRDYYRETFGVTLLAYWLAANRISDVTTQFIGLYMTQIYVPEVARTQPATGAIIARYRRHLAAAAAIMVIGFVIFALAPTFFVSFVVGPGMAAAAGIVLLYLAGDVLRTWPSINANHLIAKRRVPLYVGLEVANVVFFAIGTLALFSVSPLAPAIAYIGTNLIVGLIGLILVWRIERPRGIAEHR